MPNEDATLEYHINVHAPIAACKATMDANEETQKPHSSTRHCWNCPTHTKQAQHLDKDSRSCSSTAPEYSHHHTGALNCACRYPRCSPSVPFDSSQYTAHTIQPHAMQLSIAWCSTSLAHKSCTGLRPHARKKCPGATASAPPPIRRTAIMRSRPLLLQILEQLLVHLVYLRKSSVQQRILGTTHHHITAPRSLPWRQRNWLWSHTLIVSVLGGTAHPWSGLNRPRTALLARSLARCLPFSEERYNPRSSDQLAETCFQVTPPPQLPRPVLEQRNRCPPCSETRMFTVGPAIRESPSSTISSLIGGTWISAGFRMPLCPWHVLRNFSDVLDDLLSRDAPLFDPRFSHRAALEHRLEHVRDFHALLVHS